MTKKQKKMLYPHPDRGGAVPRGEIDPPADARLAARALSGRPTWSIGYDILRKAWQGHLQPAGVRRKLSDGGRDRSVRSRWRVYDKERRLCPRPSPSCCFIRSASCSRATRSARAAATSPRSWTSAPTTRTSKRDGKLEQVDPDDGRRSAAIIVVQPGEKVPHRRRVVEDGVPRLNTSALTGESLPRDVQRGRRDHQRLHQHDAAF